MRSIRAMAMVMLAMGSLVGFAGAESAAPEPTTPPTAPPLVPPPVAPSAMLSQPSVITLDPAGLQLYHFTGEIGAGIYSIHGAGGSSAPFIGTRGSVNVFGDRLGAGVDWFEGSSSSSRFGSWSISHHP